MMEKVMNFRDLGGIFTSDGRRVKSNLFYRSAMLNDATAQDIAFLQSLKLQSIFDYRDDDETKIMASNPYAKLGAKYHNIPAGLNNDKLYKLKKIPHVFKAFQKFTLDDVKCTYTHLPFDNLAYKSMVQAMVEGKLPMLQHCSAGKDRAGLGSALILAILGVGYDEILDDYMKSLAIKEYLQSVLVGYIPRIVRKPILKRFEPLFIVDKELLDTAWQAIKDKYGTMEAYFLAEYGLDSAKIAELRDKYTE